MVAPKSAANTKSPSLAKGWPRSGRGSGTKMKLPANKSLRTYARQLRTHSTLSEVLLWNHIKQKRAYGLDFDRQKIIGNYIVDFYCAKLNLVLEIDGCSHDDKQKYDAQRDEYLRKLGLTIIHIDDLDVKNNMAQVLYSIERFISNHYPAITTHAK